MIKITNILIIVWALITFAALSAVKASGEASGGEFVIGLILWYDVTMRALNREND